VRPWACAEVLASRREKGCGGRGVDPGRLPVRGAHFRQRTLGANPRLVGWAAAAVAVLSVIALLTVGANGPADPSLGGIPGFGEVAFQITPSGGQATAGQFCALLAENEQQRARGLMGHRDLAGFDAMVFRFDADTDGPFYMRDVPVGLSIAWFGADGRFVSSTDMAPCADREGCPTYPPAAPYRLAVEVLQGGLGRLGVGEGSVLTVGGACRR